MESNILDDFSVIIQGKVFGKPGDSDKKQLTFHCIKSIRKVLTKAEIVISTWEGTDVSHLPYDKVVFNHDPGAILYNDDIPNFFNNNNRQIVSTYNGLKAATKKYVIKMRGDCQLTDTSFINFVKEYPRSPKYKFLKQRVLIPTKYSRNPRRIALLFHPSDIFQLGLLEDLLNLWNIPLQPEPTMTRGVPANKRIINDSLPGPHFKMKMCAEQYLWYAYALQHGLDLELTYFSQIPVSKILKSELSIINNFVIADAEQMGLLLPKKFIEHKLTNIYTHKEWLALCIKYSRGDISKTDELWLIVQVHASNIYNITSRAFDKAIRDCKSLIKKIFKISSKDRQNTNINLG